MEKEVVMPGKPNKIACLARSLKDRAVFRGSFLDAGTGILPFSSMGYSCQSAGFDSLLSACSRAMISSTASSNGSTLTSEPTASCIQICGVSLPIV